LRRRYPPCMTSTSRSFNTTDVNHSPYCPRLVVTTAKSPRFKLNGKQRITTNRAEGGMGWVVMSERDLHRVGVLSEIHLGNRTLASGAALLGLTTRHIRRLLDRYAEFGASGLVHGLRDRPSNRCRAAADREQALALVQDHYADFGPTLAAEKLTELRGFGVSRETLRHWMTMRPPVSVPATPSRP
jgi:hypothetical protein